MGKLRPAKQGGYLKAGFFGAEGSGKTHTAMELAMFTRDRLKLSGPIAGLDTETGINDWQERVKHRTGTDLLIQPSGSFDDLVPFLAECLSEGVSVAVIDSLTHLWDELCSSFLRKIQDNARNRNWQVPDRLEFHHWSTLKTRWSAWVRAFLNSPLHIIVCGRLGAVYEMRTNDKNKKEVVQVGEKMKATTFGYECRMLVKTERDEEFDPARNRHRIVQTVLVLKERWDVLTGHRAVQPRPEFFAPHVDKLDPAGHVEIPASASEHDIDEGGADTWARERALREQLTEELKALLDAAQPGQTADAKKARGELVYRHLSVRTQKAAAARSSGELKAAIRGICMETGLAIPLLAMDDGSESDDPGPPTPPDDTPPEWMS